MTKFLIPALGLLALATPVFADTSAPVTFMKDGDSYQYTVSEHKGVQIIQGKVLSTGEPFTLRVAGGRASGDVGGREVSFSLAEVPTGVAAATALSSR